MSRILLKNMLLVNEHQVRKGDLRIQDGRIAEISDSISSMAEETILDGKGRMCVSPGLFDMHVHFRDPGFTYKEDIETGAAAALAGGFTGVACMPNTRPQIDTVGTVQYIVDKARPTGVKIYPVACITKGLAGEELCDYEALKNAGAIGISDDGKPVKNAEKLRQALALSRENGLLVISHCEDMDIIGNGILHKGKISEVLGVPGMDRASEDSITAREIAIANAENAHIHIAHVSTKGSVELIRDAKRRGVKVSCETCPHYFMYTDDKLLNRDADYRMNPPLREESDRQAVLEGVLDGTIDCIVTDHAPHSPEEKADFLTAPNGVIGVETSLAATLTKLYHTGLADLPKIIALMSANPRRLLGLPYAALKVGGSADLTVFDPEEEWVVEPDKLHSKSKNAIFKGEHFKGRVRATIVEGVLRYSAPDGV